MAATISAYNYKFSLDANDFAGGARLTKSELGMVNQALRESQTAQDKSQASFNALAKAYSTGKVSMDQTIQAYEHLAKTTPEAIAAQKKHAEAMAEGERIMSAHKPALTGYREEMTKLNQLLKMGAIDQRAHAREVAAARGGLAAKAIGMSGIPVVGDLVQKGVSAAAIHPALAAVTVGAGAAKVAMDTFLATADKMATVGKGATRLGISTQEYITLGKAAKTVNVDMNELTSGFSQMNRMLGEATVGGKTQQEAFANLGLNYKDLAKLSPYEAFKKVSDSLRDIQDPFARSALASKLFGEESSKLMALLRMGGTAFDDYYAAAKRSGEMFSPEENAKVQASKLAYDELGKSWETLKMNATVLAAVPLEKFFTSINTTFSTDKGVGMFERMEASSRAIMDYMTLGLASAYVLPEAQKPRTADPETTARTAENVAKQNAMTAADDAYYKSAKETNQKLQEKLDLLKAVNSGMADNSEEAQVMADAEKAHNLVLGQQVIDQMEIKKQRDADTKAKEEAARKQEQLTQSGKEFIAGLQEEARLRELTGGKLENATNQLAVYRMQVKGLSGDLLAEAMAEAKAADAAKARDDINKQVDQALQQGQTPAEKYAAEIKKLQEWQRAGADAAKVQRLMDDAAKSYFATQKDGRMELLQNAEATEQNLLLLARRDREQFDAAARQKSMQQSIEAKARIESGIATPEDQVGWQPAGTYDSVPQLPDVNAPIGMTWTPPEPAAEMPMPGWLLAQQSILDHPTAQPDETWPMYNRRFEQEAARTKEREAAQAAAIAPEYNPWGDIPGDAIGAGDAPAQIGVTIAQLTDTTQQQNAILERIATAAESTARKPDVKIEEVGSL